jgi:hypothetical protein
MSRVTRKRSSVSLTVTYARRNIIVFSLHIIQCAVYETPFWHRHQPQLHSRDAPRSDRCANFGDLAFRRKKGGWASFISTLIDNMLIRSQVTTFYVRISVVKMKQLTFETPSITELTARKSVRCLLFRLRRPISHTTQC